MYILSIPIINRRLAKLKPNYSDESHRHDINLSFLLTIDDITEVI